MVSFKFLIPDSSEPQRQTNSEGVVAAVVGVELQGGGLRIAVEVVIVAFLKMLVHSA